MTTVSTQIDKLDALIATAQRSRDSAKRGNLFESMAGHALVNAMFDLTECAELYELRNEIGFSLGLDSEGSPVLYLEDRAA